MRGLGLPDRRIDVVAKLAQQMAHRGEDKLILAAEIMRRERRRNPRLMRNLRDGHIQRTALANSTNGGVDQLAPTQGLHPDLGHNLGPFSG